MSVDIKPRSVLSELRRPLLQPNSGISAELESRLLGSTASPITEAGRSSPQLPLPAPAPATPVAVPPSAKKAKSATVPVTFHLPIELRDKIKLTAQAKQMTMLEIAIDALNGYLGHNPVSEADVRRMLGL